MTTATLPKQPKKRKRPGPPTLGHQVAAWMERCLVHGEGDYYGEPFRLRPWQRSVVLQAYELLEDGTRRYDEVLVGFPKGQGKTELAAAFACAEFAGPVQFDGWDEAGNPVGKQRVSPLIPVAAASFEQADLVFGAARVMIREGALNQFCDVFDTEILLKGRPGRMYRVAAKAGTNDGGKPTFWVADELHEWTGVNKERVHLVLSNNRSKRKGAWQLAITTAGWDMTSLLGKLYSRGRRIAAGDEQENRFLCVWLEAPAGELDTPEKLDAAIRAANPAAGDFLPIENIRQRHLEMPEHEFRRYHLNQFTTAPDRWLPVGTWEACNKPRAIDPTEPVVLGFDGSFSRDATAIVGATLDGHLFVVKCWEKPAGAGDDWRVPVADVVESIRQTCRERKVLCVGCDPHLWREQLETLTNEGLPIVEWPSHQKNRMVPACAQFYDGVTSGKLSHDGDERLARHIAQCVLKTDSFGPRIVKDHKDSVRRIDLAVAAVIAYDLALRHEAPPGPWLIASVTRGI